MEFYVNENTFKERLKLFFIKNQRSSEWGLRARPAQTRAVGVTGVQEPWAGAPHLRVTQPSTQQETGPYALVDVHWAVVSGTVA